MLCLSQLLLWQSAVYMLKKQKFIFLRIVLRSVHKVFINTNLSSSGKAHLCCRIRWHLERHQALLSRLLRHKVLKYTRWIDVPWKSCLLNIHHLLVIAFPGGKNLELYRVQYLNQKKKWVCFSWIGTKLKVKLVWFEVYFHVFFTCNWMFCFTFMLLKYFRKAFTARGQWKQTNKQK